jgi:hypothetical protein
MKSLVVPLCILVALGGAIALAATLLGFVSAVPALLSGYAAAGLLAIASRDYGRTSSSRARREREPTAETSRPRRHALLDAVAAARSDSLSH